MKNDTELLESRVRKQRVKMRLGQKRRYQLAKDLGFSATEAGVLQNWSEARVRAIAESKTKES